MIEIRVEILVKLLVFYFEANTLALIAYENDLQDGLACPVDDMRISCGFRKKPLQISRPLEEGPVDVRAVERVQVCYGSRGSIRLKVSACGPPLALLRRGEGFCARL